MTINIAIQLNNTREDELMADKLALDNIGIKPIFYGMIPFSEDITGVEEFDKHREVIPFGAVKLIKLWQKGLFPKSTKVFYNEVRFDQRTYGPILQNLLLNYDAVYTTLGKVKDVVVDFPMFIKPTRDLKAFAGLIVEAGRTPGEAIFSLPQDSSLTDDEPVLMAPLKDIVREYRNFVVDGEIVDSSTYKVGDVVKWEPITDKERMELKFFHEYMKRFYEPIFTYVVDFARMKDGSFRVIEFNCLNCSGMYSIDREKLFRSLLSSTKRWSAPSKTAAGWQTPICR